MDGDSASKQPLQRFTRDVYSVRRRTMVNDNKEKKQTNEKIKAQRHCYVCGFIRSVTLKWQRYGRNRITSGAALYCNGWLYSHRKQGKSTEPLTGAVRFNFFKSRFLHRRAQSTRFSRRKIKIPSFVFPTCVFWFFSVREKGVKLRVKVR